MGKYKYEVEIESDNQLDADEMIKEIMLSNPYEYYIKGWQSIKDGE